MEQEYYKKYEPIFGAWIIDSEIGRGSFGKVYKIVRKDLSGEYVAALKAITVPFDESERRSVSAELGDSSSTRTYFYSIVEDIVSEFRLMSQLKGNSNIVSYEDHLVIEHTDDVGWDILIRMELLTPLNEYIHAKPLDSKEIVRLGIDICRALELCQKKRILHRDIKPENILVSQDGDFKLGDFGIARTAERTTAGLSKKGTSLYMAPEVYRGEPYGASVDIYSLGLVLYRLLNDNLLPFLTRPITPSNKEEAFVKRLSGEVLPRPMNADARLSEIILKACAFKPGDRYESARQMRLALEGYISKGDTNTAAGFYRKSYTAPQEHTPEEEKLSSDELTNAQFGGAYGQAAQADESATEGIFGDRTSHSDAQRQPKTSRRGEDVRVNLPLSFMDAAKGCTKMVSFSALDVCDNCGGKGVVFGKKCEKCGGDGRVRTTRTLNVTVRPGIDDAQTLRLEGRGNAGINGGVAGDVFANISILPDDVFRRKGYNVYTSASLTPSQAASGTELIVPTIDGKSKLTIPAGTKNGAVLRLGNKGIQYLNGNGRGDHYVGIIIEQGGRNAPYQAANKPNDTPKGSKKRINPLSIVLSIAASVALFFITSFLSKQAVVGNKNNARIDELIATSSADGTLDSITDAQALLEIASEYAKAGQTDNALAALNLAYASEQANIDYSYTIPWLREAADKGNAEAQLLLGFMYVKGCGVEQDYEQAVEWYRKSAAQEYSAAQYNLGFMYQWGFGVDMDSTQALEWYKKAAEQGDEDAMFEIGHMYEIGVDVEKDYALAAEWYLKAAQKGHAIAQNNLGFMYDYGIGVEMDYAQALEWYLKSAEQGNATAQCNIGIKCLDGYGVEQDYALAFEWFQMAALQGQKDAQSGLGYLYENGLGVEQDTAKAIEWYQKAALQGDENAQARLDALSG